MALSFSTPPNQEKEEGEEGTLERGSQTDRGTGKRTGRSRSFKEAMSGEESGGEEGERGGSESILHPPSVERGEGKEGKSSLLESSDGSTAEDKTFFFSSFSFSFPPLFLPLLQ